MTVTFDDLVARQTVANIRTAVIAAANVVNWSVSLLPPLSRLRKLALDVVPIVVELASRPNAEAIRGGLLDFASGIWLEALAINLFGLDGRILLTFATTTVTFANAGPEPYSFAVGEVIVGNGFATYKNTEAFTLAASGPLATKTVDVIATIAGSAGNADAGDITTMVTTFDGVTCTNPSAARGTDREEDEALRVRARLSRAAISNSGHVDAIKFIALSALRTDGSAIGATRVQVVEHVPSIGDVSTYLADADGALAGDDVDRIDYLIRTLVTPTGVNYLGTFAAVEIIVPITYTARARERDGFTTDEIEDFVEVDINDLFADYPIGGYIEAGPEGTLYRSEISAVISQAQSTADDPRPIVDVTLTLPAANVTLDPGEVAVPGVIISTVTLVSG
jgi:hypothetical protein